MSGLQTEYNNVRNTFSSWDSCMAKSYCKYPVIIGIVVGAIILISVLWCVASCICCGASLCGSCVQCLTCFRCCGACSRGGGGGGGTRHKDDYSKMPPSPYNGYQPPTSGMTYQPPGSHVAHFDAPTKNVHADSLPAMPTWDAARSVRVEDHSAPANGSGNDVEMGSMHPTQSPARVRGGYNQVPHGPVSPMSPPTNYSNFEGQSHPYNSDIGAQRLPQQQTGYSDFNPSPLSPAPTYRTVASVPTYANTDRFARGAISPAPSDFHNRQQTGVARGPAWSPPPTSIRHEATGYESYRGAVSPQMESQPLTYSHHEDQHGDRPPSLLQIGRKPVMGSQREI